MVLSLTIWNHAIGQDTLRIASGEWPPYSSYDLDDYGLVNQIVTEVFAQKNIVVEYGFFPWKRSFQLARDGIWDGTSAWFSSEERARDFHISDPIVGNKHVFFHLQSFAFDWKNFDDLKDIRIGATIQYHYGKEFQEAEKNGVITVDRVASDTINFKKLLGGRIQIFSCDLLSANATLMKNFTSEQRQRIVYHPRPVRVDPIHLLLSKKVEGNAQLIRLFNQGLKSIDIDERIKRYSQTPKTD